MSNLNAAPLPDIKEILQLIQKLEEYINDSGYIPATAYFRSKVLLGLVSKLLTTSRAVCCLVDAGFYGEAFGLSRTLIEIFLTVRYVTNDDTEARAQLYAEYIAKTQVKLIELSAKHFSPNHYGPTDLGKFKALAENYKNPLSWVGVRGHIKQMAIELDKYEVDASGQPITHEFDYEFVYWQTSFYTHATIQSLLDHGSPPGEPFRIRRNIGADIHRGHEALFNVVAFLCKTFVCAFRGLRDEQPEELLRQGFSLLKSYAKAMAEYRRWAQKEYGFPD